MTYHICRGQPLFLASQFANFPARAPIGHDHRVKSMSLRSLLVRRISSVTSGSFDPFFPLDREGLLSRCFQVGLSLTTSPIITSVGDFRRAASTLSLRRCISAQTFNQENRSLPGESINEESFLVKSAEIFFSSYLALI